MRIHLMTVTILCMICLLIYSCKNDAAGDPEEAKKEIAQAEKDFEKMAAEKGIAEAFAFFADSTAVIRGANDSLIRGKEGIRNLFSAERFKKATVSWSPDFVDAAASGELGYTYGKYTWQSTDSAGKTNESKGVFHTVWKKQKDGSWKFVWD
ncbi:MAG: nuclear transport factor 2 family protein [Chitinophagaceae bacterium]